MTRGYLEREFDTTDRRRMTVTLTERGHLAAATSRAAVERIDAALRERVGADALSRARATLGNLVDHDDESA